MRIAIVADVHVGNHRLYGGPLKVGVNDRCRLVLNTLENAAITADELGCDMFVVAGDLFDTHNPIPQVVAAAANALFAFDGLIRLLAGNHEQVTKTPCDNALCTLGLHDNIITNDLPCNDQLITYVPAGFDIPKGDGKSVLICHVGIEGDNTPPWLKGTGIHVDTIKSLGYRAVFAGDWHQYRDFGDQVYQVGALCPTGFDNPGTEGYGSLLIYDTFANTVERIEIPGPRFVEDEVEACTFMEGYSWFVKPKEIGVDTKVSEEIFKIFDNGLTEKAIKDTIDKEDWDDKDNVFQRCLRYVK